MRRFLKWFGSILGAFVILALIALAYIYVKSSTTINQKFSVQQHSQELEIPSDSSSLAEGKKLAATRGCFGCHGPDGQGKVLTTIAYSTRLVATNLSQAVQRYSFAELEKIIRHGIRPDSTSVLAMPSEVYNTLSDSDLEKIIAYLETLPESNPGLPETNLGPVGRFLILNEESSVLSAKHIDQQAPHSSEVPKKTVKEFGEYLITTTCTECHGMDLMGDEVVGNVSPPLTVVKGYSKESFKKLMNTGIALGGRELELMSDVSQERFNHFTDEEIEAMYEYLSTFKDSTE